MKYVLTVLSLLFTLPAFAEEKAEVVVPLISFPQQVDIVYETKKNPSVLDVKIKQDNADVTLDAIVDKNIDRDGAKKIAMNLVMMTKVLSLDDKPKKKDLPGKGLYNYKVTIKRSDAVVLVAGDKPAKEEKLSF